MSDGFSASAAEKPPQPPSPLGALAIGALALVLCLALVARVWTDRAAAETTRTSIVAASAREDAMTRLILGLSEAESAQRGYVITGNRAFLAPYEPARRDLGVSLTELDALYAARTGQDDRIHRLRMLVAAKFGEMDDVLRLRDAEGLEVARRRVDDEQGRRLMVAIRDVAEDFIRTERLGLSDSLTRIAGERHRVDLWIMFILVVIVGCVVAGLVASWRVRLGRYRLQRQSWDALVRMRAIFASTGDAMLTLNPSGSIETVNAAVTRMLGYAPEELERRDVATLIDLAPSGAGTFEQRIGLSRGTFAAPFRTSRAARHRDGHEVPVDVALGAMPLADGDHVVVALRDVSERHETERLKDEFIGTVSHELRTPLTSVIGALGLLRSGTAGVLPAQAQRLADIAENNARRLIRLINDILDIDRIGSGRLKLDSATIDLAEIARRGADDAQGLGDQRGVRLIHEGGTTPLPVSGDAERLLQVVGNLLSNAIRFSPPHGTVRVTTAREGGKARLTVSDEGPGVPPEFRQRLFERFSQSRAGAAIPGGTGLGLAISREIVRAHDGALWYEDAEGGGARFCLALELLAERSDSPAPGRRRVLLCEDDADAAAVLGAMIEREDVAVDRCGTAREAQAMALSGRYDCVLLDLHLPDASGLAAVRALRAHEGTRGLPLIVVSGEAAAGGRSEGAHALDVIDWIDKPVDRERLLDALSRALSRADGVPTLLHVDDDPDMLEVTAIALADRGRMLHATSVAQAREVLARITPDIVILDINLPDGSGLDLMPELFAADGTAVPTIIYSASDMMPEAVKPFEAALVKSRRSLETLSDTIKTVLARVGEAA